MHFPTSFAVLGLAALSSAHVIISTPKPFAESVAGNGPLSLQGEDFPCKVGNSGKYTAPAGGSTAMPLGSSQPLNFIGSAVHGGGSCQISITYDKAPNKNSVWKVIHSIQGGCPIATAGNIGDDANMVTPNSFTFTIPQELPTGEAVLAWTWFNRVGNREMYMNCAPISITGNAARRDEDILASRNVTQLMERDVAAYNSLPDMFVANIDNGCAVSEGKPLKFPNPGSSLKVVVADGETSNPTGSCAKAAGGGSTPPQLPSQIIPAPSSSAAAPSPTASKSASIPGGVFFPKPDPTDVAPSAPATTSVPAVSNPVISAPATSVTTIPAISAPVQAPSPSATQPTTLTVVPTKPTSVSAAPPASTGIVGGGSQLTGPCSSEGSWNCIGGTTFQRCASGTWSVAMAVAAGTQCTGDSASFEIKALAARRNIRFSGAHIRRHAHRS